MALACQGKGLLFVRDMPGVAAASYDAFASFWVWLFDDDTHPSVTDGPGFTSEARLFGLSKFRPADV